MMTKPPADMPRDYTSNAEFTAALADTQDFDTYQALTAAVEKYGLLPDQITAASLLAIDSGQRWYRAGKPVLQDRELYDALCDHEDALGGPDEQPTGKSWIDALDTLAQLAAAGRYYSQGRRHDQLLAALATSERLSAASDQILVEAVQSARDAGRSWEYIGEALGLARQNAYRRFAGRMRETVRTPRAD